MGAQALIHPMPRIPDSLLGERINVTALARFHISKNGTQTVELIMPTHEPLLDRAIIEALRKWRFAPALRDGIAVEATIDLRIPIQVR